MDSTPNASFPVLLVDMTVAGCMLVCGFALGWLIRKTRPAPAMGTDAVCAQNALSQLHELTSSVADDVGQHTTRVREIGSELEAAKSSGSPGLDQLVLGSLSEIIEANERLQEQVAHAESKLREQAKEIENQMIVARTDALTNLSNRRAFDDELNRRLAEWQRRRSIFSLVIMDVDHFKKFNDTHGHQTGDEVLKGVARTLTATMREMDLVARYGGEEFAAILPATNLAEGLCAAERARVAVAGCNFHFEGKELAVAMSLGVTEVREGDTASLIVKRADAALYAAKAAGRNRVCFHDGENCHPAAERAKEADASPIHAPAAAKVLAPPSKPTLPKPATDTSAQNRANFCVDLRRRLLDCQQNNEPLSLLLADVDDFHKLVERLGPEVGELILQSVAAALGAEIQTTDVMSRHGYGQFAMMMPGTSLDNATDLAERVRSAIAESTIEIHGSPLRFTIRLGLADALPGDDASGLIERADTALIASKAAGRNCTHFNHAGRCMPASSLTPVG